MATVYLARDLKHDRDVALKVLRPELAAVIGAERFVQEIKTTAHLQHPNILPLFDSGEADSFLYYVMPHVEGESLRQKMDREKQLSIDETIELAKAVAGALAYAHDQGIVHRDIKPENILLQRGQPVVADFGIALAVSHAGGTRLTETGLSLGTPHYMSPEQATGDRELDGRSDVYSLGAMVYEMLAGEPPHHGSTMQAIVARILSAEPEPITRHRNSVPVHVDAAVRKALDKTPADRFATATRFAEALTNPSLTAARTTATPVAVAPPLDRRRAFVAVSAAAALFAVFAAWGWLRAPAGGPAPVIRYRVLERTLDQTQDFGTNFAISPDGNVIVKAGFDERGEGFGLRVQRRSQLESSPLRGAEGAHQPFFSPDGRQVGFVTISRALRVASLGDEPTVTLVDSGIVRGGGSWGTDGYIYLTGGNVGIEAGVVPGIVRLPSSGGSLEIVTQLDTTRNEVGHVFPEALPGGRGVLFTVSRERLYTAQDQEIAVADVATGSHRALLPGVQARWSPTGHVLVVQADGRLVALPFDERGLEATGTAVPLLDGVRVDGLATADIAVSASGRLVYGAGTSDASFSLLMQWTRRDGQSAIVDTAWSGVFLSPSVSPDGRMMAVQLGVAPSAEVWVKQLDRGPFSRLTFDGRFSGNPSWTADGRSVVFLSDRDGSGTKAYVKSADGSDEPRQLIDVAVTEARYSRDGRWLVYVTDPRVPDPGIYALEVGQDTTPVLLVPRRFGEAQISLSPDGRWLAYTSRESGQTEIYVRPFPTSASARWQVSVAGGVQPHWAPNGRELFYNVPTTGDVVSVTVAASATFSAGEQRRLLSLENAVPQNGWDIAPDGRFAFVATRTTVRGAIDRELVVVENFFQELRAKLPR